MSRCIGYGEFDNRRAGGNACTNEADTPAGLWCQRCEELRRSAISAQMAAVTRSFPGERERER